MLLITTATLKKSRMKIQIPNCRVIFLFNDSHNKRLHKNSCNGDIRSMSNCLRTQVYANEPRYTQIYPMVPEILPKVILKEIFQSSLKFSCIRNSVQWVQWFFLLLIALIQSCTQCTQVYQNVPNGTQSSPWGMYVF